MAGKFTLSAEILLRAPSNVSQVVQQIQSQLRNVSATVNLNVPPKDVQTLKKVQADLNKTGKAAKVAGDSIAEFGKQSRLALKRFGAYTAATVVFFKLIGAIKSGISEAISFERELVKISQVTGIATKHLSSFTSEITNLSTSLGVSSSKLLETSRLLAQTGLSASNVSIALKALAKSELAPTFGDIIKTTEGSIAIFQQFGLEADKLEDALSSINAVSKRFAVESEDIITAVRRTGGAFSAAGGNLNELIALFTSVRQTTRESAESIATGFRTIFTRLQRASTQNFLSELGIQLRDLNGQFVGPLKAVRALSQALNNLEGTDPRFAQVVEELGGFRQVSKVIPLIQQFAVAERALAVAQQGRTSITQDAILAQQSLAVQLQKVKEEFLSLIRIVVSDDVFSGLAKSAISLARAIIQVAKALTPLIPLITAFGAIRLGSLTKGFVRGFVGSAPGFVSGGLVPGHGNRDTVPARLTPGEFVIKKPVVEKIGVGNLSRLNKGGIVQKFANGGSVRDLTDDDLIKRASSTLDIDTNRAKRRLGHDKSLLIKDIEEKEKRIGRKFEVSIGTFDRPAVGGIFARPVSGKDNEVRIHASKKDKLINEFLTSMRKFRPGVELPSSKINLVRDQVNVPIGRNFLSPEKSKAFDDVVEPAIVNLITDLSKSFDPGDNTATIKNALDKIDFNDVRGKFFEASIAGIIGPQSEDRDRFDFPEGIGKLHNIFSDPIKGAFIDAKIHDSNDLVSKIKDNALIEIASGSQLGKRIAEYVQVNKIAKGGMVDSVPALLTPGEFVFNKQAVNRIGVGNLERINKFADGGIVKGGGLLGGNDPIARGAQLLLVTSIISGFVNQLGTVTDGMQKFIDSVNAVVTTFILFTSITKGAASGIKELFHTQNIQFKNSFLGRNITNSGGRVSELKFLSRELKDLKGQRAHVLSDKQLTGDERLRGVTKIDKDIEIAAVGIKDSLHTARNSLQKWENRLLASSTVIAGVSAVLIAVGNNLVKSGQTGIEQGRFISGASNLKFGRSAVSAGTFGGSGLAIGAAIGSFFPVVGTALGAAIGGLGGILLGSARGFVKGGEEAERLIRKVKFDRAFGEFERNLQEILSNQISLDVGISRTERFSSRAIHRLRTTKSPEALQTTLGQLRSQSTDLNQSFGKIIVDSLNYSKAITTSAEGLSKIDRLGIAELLAEFTNRISESINVFSLINDIPAVELERGFRRQIESQARLIIMNEQTVKSFDDFAKMSRAIVDVNRALNEASSNINTFSNNLKHSVELISGEFEALEFSSVSDALTNPSQFFDVKDFEKRLNKNIIVDDSSINELKQSAITAFKVSRRIPDALLQLRDSPILELEQPDIGKALLDILDIGNTSQVGKSIRAGIQKILSSAGDTGKLKDAFSDISGLTEQLLSNLQPIFDTLGEADRKFVEQFNELAQIANRRNQLELQLLQNAQDRINIEDQQIRQMTDLLGGNVDFKALQRLEDKRLKLLFGSSTPFVPNIVNSSQRVREAELDVISSEESERKSLIETLESERLAHTKNIQGLSFLADVSSRTAISTEKLNKLRSDRGVIRDFATDFIFGDTTSQKELNSQMITAIIAGVTGSLEDIPTVLRPGLKSLLDRFANVELAAFGGLSGRKLQQKLTADALFRSGKFSRERAEEIATDITTPPEQKLLDQIEKGFKLAQEAITEKDKLLKDDMSLLTKDLNSSLTIFITDLRKVLLESKSLRLQAEIDAARVELKPLEEKEEAFQFLSRPEFGLDEESINVLRGNVKNINELKNLSFTRQALKGLNIENFGLQFLRGLTDVKRGDFISSFNESVGNVEQTTVIDTESFIRQLDLSLQDLLSHFTEDQVSRLRKDIQLSIAGAGVTRDTSSGSNLSSELDLLKFSPIFTTILKELFDEVAKDLSANNEVFARAELSRKLGLKEPGQLTNILSQFDVIQKSLDQYGPGEHIKSMDERISGLKSIISSTTLLEESQRQLLREILNEVRVLNKNLSPKSDVNSVEEKHKGGPIFNNGVKRLQSGEFVIKQSSSNRLGKDVLEFINEKGELPGFQRGGRLSREERRKLLGRRSFEDRRGKSRRQLREERESIVDANKAVGLSGAFGAGLLSFFPTITDLKEVERDKELESISKKLGRRSFADRRGGSSTASPELLDRIQKAKDRRGISFPTPAALQKQQLDREAALGLAGTPEILDPKDIFSTDIQGESIADVAARLRKEIPSPGTPLPKRETAEERIKKTLARAKAAGTVGRKPLSFEQSFNAVAQDIDKLAISQEHSRIISKLRPSSPGGPSSLELLDKKIAAQEARATPVLQMLNRNILLDKLQSGEISHSVSPNGSVFYDMNHVRKAGVKISGLGSLSHKDIENEVKKFREFEEAQVPVPIVGDIVGGLVGLIDILPGVSGVGNIVEKHVDDITGKILKRAGITAGSGMIGGVLGFQSGVRYDRLGQRQPTGNRLIEIGAAVALSSGLAGTSKVVNQTVSGILGRIGSIREARALRRIVAPHKSRPGKTLIDLKKRELLTKQQELLKKQDVVSKPIKKVVAKSESITDAKKRFDAATGNKGFFGIGRRKSSFEGLSSQAPSAERLSIFNEKIAIARIQSVERKARIARRPEQIKNAISTYIKIRKYLRSSKGQRKGILVSHVTSRARELYDSLLLQDTQGLSRGGPVNHGGLIVPEGTLIESSQLIDFNKRLEEGGAIPGIQTGDVVPAMLEPGEFVLNRNAVRVAGIKNLTRFNQEFGRFQSGGKVKKLQGGGLSGTAGSASAISSAGASAATSSIDMTPFSKAVSDFGKNINQFAQSVDILSGLQGLEITLSGRHTVEVIINGAQVLQGIVPSVQNLISATTTEAINKMLKEKFPTVGKVVSTLGNLATGAHKGQSANSSEQARNNK